MPPSIETCAALSPAEQWATLTAGFPRQVTADLGKYIDLGSPPGFFDFASESLTADLETAQMGNVSRILLEQGLLVRAAANPAVLSAAEAVQVINLAARLDPLIGVKLVRHLAAPDRRWPEDVPEEEALRVMELIENLPGLNLVSMSLLKLTQHPSKKVRSKGAKLFGKGASSVGAFERAYADPDARVRANLIEGIAARALPLPESFTRFLRSVSPIEHPRVVAMTLLALARAGDADSSAALETLCAHPDPVKSKAAQFARKLFQENSEVPTAADPQP